MPVMGAFFMRSCDAVMHPQFRPSREQGFRAATQASIWGHRRVHRFRAVAALEADKNGDSR